MEVEMTKIKGLLLGTAAGLLAVGGAQAADMPVKAAPVNYVKICSLYGDGFYYIPGTDTCLKLGGYLRVQGEYNAGNGGIPVGSGGGGVTSEAAQGRFTRDLTNDFNYRVRAVTSWDVRQQTEYGTLRTYIRFGASNQTPVTTGGGSTFAPFWDRAFMQFAGFTVGRSQSFFDLFTYGGAYSYHNVRVSGDTGASGQNLWAYTAQFGNGFSGSLSLEDPINHRSNAGVIDVTQSQFFGQLAASTPDNGFQNNIGGFGFRVPDVVANLRVDQAWGFAGISAVLHDASGGYYNSFGANACGAAVGGIGPNCVDNGHPEDKYGWALAGGAKFNLAGGDMVGFNVCYSEGAAGRCTNENGWLLYNNSNSVGVGWLSDGVFSTGTQIELTRVWSALAAYEHIWNPKWRTAVGGGYVDVSYNDAARNLILSRTAGAAAACGVPLGVGGTANLTAVTLNPGSSCSPDYSFWEAYTRTQWNPVPQLDIGLQVMYTHHNTAFKGPATIAANGSRPAVVNGIIDDQNVWSAMFRWQRNFYP
jgi:hypothetical protein